MIAHELTLLEARCRGEFLDMPGLQLTVRQAARLFGVDPIESKALFEALVENGFLRRSGDTYLRAGAGRYYGLTPAEIVRELNAACWCRAASASPPNTIRVVRRP